MSLLDDLKNAQCTCDASEGNHSDDECLDNLKSKIVAALEAAERLSNILVMWKMIAGSTVEHGDPGSHVGRIEIRDYRDLFEKHDALVAALKGEEVKA